MNPMLTVLLLNHIKIKATKRNALADPKPPPPIKERKKYNGQKSKSANADKILKNIQMND